MTDLEALQNFLPEFHLEFQEIRKCFVNHDRDLIKGFVEDFIPVNTGIEKAKKEEASEFNIFQIMRYGNYETKLHTPFLKNLLDPRGSHGQSSFFIDSFFKKFLLPDFLFDQTKDFKIEEEKVIGELGRIDIYVQFSIENTIYRIAIENKLNHFDTKNQLNNYLEYLRREAKSSDKYFLIFLNKYGQLPDLGNSINIKDYNEEVEQKSFITLSYVDDITKWIDEAYEELNAITLKNSLSQYLQIIKSF